MVVNYSGNYVISAMYGPLCITFVIYTWLRNSYVYLGTLG